MSRVLAPLCLWMIAEVRRGNMGGREKGGGGYAGSKGAGEEVVGIFGREKRLNGIN